MNVSTRSRSSQIYCTQYHENYFTQHSQLERQHILQHSPCTHHGVSNTTASWIALVAFTSISSIQSILLNTFTYRTSRNKHKYKYSDIRAIDDFLIVLRAQTSTNPGPKTVHCHKLILEYITRVSLILRHLAASQTALLTFALIWC